MSYPPLQPVNELPEGPWEERILRGPILCGVTYEAFTITLFWRVSARPPRPGTTDTGIDRLYLQMHHGGGTFFYRVSSHLVECVLPDWLALPDAVLIGILDSIWTADREGRDAAAEQYRQAFIDRRLKKKRRGRGRYDVWIDDPAGREARLRANFGPFAEQILEVQAQTPGPGSGARR